MFLFALSGVDGSGKSTFADQLVRSLAQEDPQVSVTRLWLRYSPRRTRPGGLQSTVSAEHKGHPAKRLLRRSGLATMWIGANTALYKRQLEWQLGAAHSADVVVADRFVLDFLVDQVAAGMLAIGAVPPVAARLPQAHSAVQLDVEDAELTRRLKPGDDGARVLQQAWRYREVARLLGVPAVDGRDPSALSSAVGIILGGVR